MTPSEAIQQANHAYIGALVDELARAGVRHFCVAPGSRSTPLAIMVARHSSAKLWMHLDERSAGFFALGMAKASREAVALVCTSGTAAANFMPAVVEAYYARVPLVVLTADRPHELRDNGAPQTIDQINLFGRHAKWFADLAEPDASPELLRYVRASAARAVATAARGPAGPVHLNCPVREPLIPVPPTASDSPVERAGGQPYVAVTSGTRAPDPALVSALAEQLLGARRGLIVCGPQDNPALAAPLAELAGALGYPILADPLSGLRCGPHDRSRVLDCYDAFLRDADFVARHAPEVVLRFGAMPTSKPVLQYLQRHSACRQIVVDGDGGWNEPTLLASDVIHADGRLLCEALEEAIFNHRERSDSIKNVINSASSVAEDSSWLERWLAADRSAREAIDARMATLDEPFEGRVFAELAELLPDGALLYAGNSMPVRDMDTFFPGGDRAIRMLANRGANGIDGVVSSALGASAASGKPTVLAIGDLSFYHDSNGLLAARQHRLNAVIVLINNDGGGIFSFLPQSALPEHFEALFGTPHGLDFRPLAEMYGATHTLATTWEAFRAAVQNGVETGGLHVVEVRTDRARNVTLHREMWRVVSATLAS